METFTQADLIGYMRRAAGEDDAIGLDGDIAEITFADLGYDSLAVMEISSLVGRELGVRLPDEVTEAETPKQFVELVNELLTASV
jgi:minimal PKS acyl carrier protein